MPTLDRYVTPLKLPMSVDLFWRFPHLAAYKAEHRDGQVELTYRPRLSMARLPVAPRHERAVGGVNIAPIDVGADVERLAKLFAAAFSRVPPLDTMAATTRRHAADAAIRHTAGGGDGAVFTPACVAAIDAATGKLVGAAIVTHVALRHDEWPEPALPVPLLNLTWLFVSPDHQRRRIASAMLDRVVNVLADERVPWLVSHVPHDNAPSVLLHWRHGFELVSANGVA